MTPTPLTPTNRTPPAWRYDWERFPAIWFGANLTGFENDAQLRLLANFSLILLGWQAEQVMTNYTNLLDAQQEQLRRIKRSNPSTPTFLYLPVAGAQPSGGFGASDDRASCSCPSAVIELLFAFLMVYSSSALWDAVDALAAAIQTAVVSELLLHNNGLCGLWLENSACLADRKPRPELPLAPPSAPARLP